SLQSPPTSVSTPSPYTTLFRSTDGGQCTANFVFTDDAGTVYVGYAAHCAGTGEATETDGCTTESLPPGTPVSFRENGNLLTNGQDRKSTRLNSSHVSISYAVFC